MLAERESKISQIIFLLIIIFSLNLSAYAKYSGGLGELNNPYQIATPEDLMSLDDNTEDYNKHFILTADIDLDPNLPGRKVFNKAVIGIDWSNPFRGVLDGNDHVIKNLHIEGTSDLGLFAVSESMISNLRLENVQIKGTGDNIGGLAGSNQGTVSNCYSTGTVIGGGSVGGIVGLNMNDILQSYSTCLVNGRYSVGGLVGDNIDTGNVIDSYSTGSVSGNENIGGLVGANYFGASIYTSYSNGTTNGENRVGGLVGRNYISSIDESYSRSSVDGISDVGGLVGTNTGDIDKCYSTGTVTGNRNLGGLVGNKLDEARYFGNTTASFWDTETSGQLTSAGGIAGTTAEMQTSITFEQAGWGCNTVWVIDQGNDYPRLSWEGKPGQLIYIELSDFLEGEGTQENPYILYTLDDIDKAVSFSLCGLKKYFRLGFLSGEGTQENPYLINTTDEFYLFGACPFEMNKHFKLMDDIDLSDIIYSDSVKQKFTGTFNGNGHKICNLTITGENYQGEFGLGLFGYLQSAEVRDLGVVDVNITGSGVSIAGFVGWNNGSIISCYCTGSVSGGALTGGLVGWNTGRSGSITSSYSSCIVTGSSSVGGLVGSNSVPGSINTSYSTGTVAGIVNVGGLVGSNMSNINTSYSLCTVSGEKCVGGLVGYNSEAITMSYSAGTVSGVQDIGGLVGSSRTRVLSRGSVTYSFWDIDISGLIGSNGGVGLTTAEMMDPYMLGMNGFADDPNWILNPGLDYPRLAWEGTPGQIIPEPEIDLLEGDGTEEDPYQINTAGQLILLSKASIFWDKSFVLDADIDLNPNLPDGQVFEQAIIPQFSGVFNGNNHTISNLVISGASRLGMFGWLEGGAVVTNLGIVDANITGSGYYIGGLVGFNGGNIIKSHSNGKISGDYYVGGLAGSNYYGNIDTSNSKSEVNGEDYIGGLTGYNYYGNIDNSYSISEVTGNENIGGLVGENDRNSIITKSYSTGIVTGCQYVGGLAGENNSSINTSYSNSTVTGQVRVGGLVGSNFQGDITSSFWDMETSGQITSRGGTGLTTADMQTESTFTDAGWDFEGETTNGTEDIWWMPENDYPKLWWQAE